MKNRVFRILITVVLVCCMIVNVVSIRARASALPEVAGVVTKVIPFNPGSAAAAGGAAAVGSQVFGYVCWGLGLVLTTAQVIDLMNQYSEFTGELETSIYYYPDGTWSYGVDMGFIERVRAFLFDSGVIVANSNSVSIYGVDFSSDSFLCPVYFQKYSSGSYYRRAAVYSTSPITSTVPEYPNGIVDVNGVRYYWRSVNIGSGFQKDDTLIDGYPSDSKMIEVIGGLGYDPVYATEAIELAQVYPLEVPMPDGYPEWHTNARPATNPDTQEEITVFPIPLNPNTQELPDSLTQPDIWQGTVADPYPDLDTNPDTGTDTDPDSGSTGANPSTDINDYKIDLTQFFPFCLPFDIYAFFELLAADPEAPHLEFDIEFPYMKEPWHLVIDLSAWDDTALLLRRLELLAFIIGLCVFTREKFLRS